jgi:hypothetical protein
MMRVRPLFEKHPGYVDVFVAERSTFLVSSSGWNITWPVEGNTAAEAAEINAVRI